MAPKASKSLKRCAALKRSAMKPAAPKARPALSYVEQAKAQKIALQKQTLRLLEKAKAEAVQNGIDLSEWEGDFLESVSARVKTYGRAFADPDLGAMGGTLSLRQGLKLKEIRKKAKTRSKTEATEK